MENRIEVNQLRGKVPYNLLLLADETREAIEKYIHECEIFIFDKDQETIGVIAIQWLNKNVVEIKNLAIHSDHQMLGYGRQMIDWAKAHYLERLATEMLVGTGDASVGQLLFYQKCGFEVYAIRKSFFLDNYAKPIYENGVRLKHMIVLKSPLK